MFLVAAVSVYHVLLLPAVLLLRVADPGARALHLRPARHTLQPVHGRHERCRLLHRLRRTQCRALRGGYLSGRWGKAGRRFSIIIGIYITEVNFYFSS